MSSTRRILGLDPSLTSTGWGLVEEQAGVLKAVAFGHIPTSPRQTLAERLETIYLELTAMINTFSPAACGIETIFTAANPRSALLLGHARGVALLALRRAGVPLAEFTPMQIKRAVTGKGAAAKEQVGWMVQHILALKEPPTPDDAADALAAAICYCQHHRGEGAA